MDAETALKLMKEEITKTDSKTAVLLQFGIEALEEKLNKPTLREQRQEIYKKVCAMCDKPKQAANKYELMELCESCPLLELEK